MKAKPAATPRKESGHRLDKEDHTMKALAVIAAALLSGHHHVVPTHPGRAMLETRIACAGAQHNLHLRCAPPKHELGTLNVVRLGFSTGNHVADLGVTFRRLIVVNRFGRLAGWVDWHRVSRGHLAVGTYTRRGGEETWQFS
jgi:hypothetical protein